MKKRVFVLGFVVTVLSGVSLFLAQNQSVFAQEVQHVSDYAALEKGIDSAKEGAPVTFVLDKDLVATHSKLYILSGKDITIDGNYHTINGNREKALVDNSGTVLLKNITLTGIYSRGAGEAIYNTGTITLDNTCLTNNVSMDSGAFYNHGDMTITNGSVIAFNIGTSDSPCNNREKLYISGGTKIFNNISKFRGGAIYSYDGELEIHNSYIRNNQANSGGGIYFEGNKKFVIDSSFIQWNHADYAGGGVYTTVAPEILGTNFINANVANKFGDELYQN